ncbi:CHAT domain-containing protein [Roseivirga sp.]|uniref:CHAT domain-containing protein n=1 Tax=Roseivirga sp. TaxID=1964215 RepID=UPI002B274430|nr:CHAT domain-containing protein [Roseivirga sp.]
MNMFIISSRLQRRIAILACLLCAIFSPPLKAQDDLNAKYLKAYELVKQNQTSQSIQLLDEVMQMNSYIENVYAMYAFNYMLKDDLGKAKSYLEQIVDMGETNLYPIFMRANLKVFEGKTDEAKALVQMALQYQELEEDIQDINDAWDTFIQFGKKTDAFSELKAWLPSVKVDNNNFTNALQSYLKASEHARNGDNKQSLNSFNKALDGLSKISPKPNNTIHKWQAEIGATLYYNGLVEEGAQLLNNSYLNIVNDASIGSYVKATVGYYYSDYLYYIGNYDRAQEVIDRTLPSSQKLIGTYLHGELLLRKANVLNAQGESTEQRAIANELLQLGQRQQDNYFMAQAYNSIGTSYLVSTDPASRASAKTNLEKANDLATQNGFTWLAESVQGNLAITYWQSGDRGKAISTYETLINSLIASGRHQDAIINLNNVGTMNFFSEEYAKAVPYFEKAIAISEEQMAELDGQSRITFLQSQLSAYEFLTYSYARTGNGAGMFDAIGKQRARVLTDRLKLKNNSRKTTLQRFQSKLKDDEVALFYTLAEPGAVAINVVTKDKSYAVLNEFFKEFVALKQKYIDTERVADMQRTGFKLPANARTSGERILVEQDIANLFNQEDFETLGEWVRELLQSDKPEHASIREEFLDHYYKFLITPIANLISGKKKLIISPDGLLNFIPFETLIDSDGKFLIEKHGVRYIQSASIAGIIDDRNYSPSRKPMLAMGGAIYDEMSTVAEPARSVERMQDMNAKAIDNAAQGLSQREVYAALGFGKMDYLPGTLNEVKTMAATVPGADVYTGLEMDEAFLKKLSAEGKLANYKVVHLATHGFALSDIPQLSGVAMSIFKDEKDGEDGYLTAPEISSLKLNADLVVLSACETGLGKIYGGEGVIGLTQSLILAGANGAAVSLWAVNDASTMYFMAGMYELVGKTNMTYADAIDDMKRRFIRGEFGEVFKGTGFWSPFIHYGN